MKNILVYALVFIVVLLVSVYIAGNFNRCHGLPDTTPDNQISIICFTSAYCSPCKRAEQILYRADIGQAALYFVDVHENKELADKCDVTATPTILVCVGRGIELRTHDANEAINYVRKLQR